MIRRSLLPELPRSLLPEPLWSLVPEPAPTLLSPRTPITPLQTSEVGLGGLIALVVFFGAGLLLVFQGFRTYQVGQLLENTPTERVRSIAAGRTELAGTARPAEKRFDRPFTDGECLYAKYKIEEYDEDAGEDDPDWDTIDSGTFTAPFYLEDDTGRVLVDADRGASFEISGDNRTKITVPGRKREPKKVIEFLDEHSSVAPQRRSGITGALFDERRRYTQWVLPVDANAYIFGGAAPRDDGDDRTADAPPGSTEASLRIGPDEGSEKFIVSDRSEDALTASYARRAPLLVTIGLLVSSVSLYFLLTEVGF